MLNDIYMQEAIRANVPNGSYTINGGYLNQSIPHAQSKNYMVNPGGIIGAKTPVLPPNGFLPSQIRAQRLADGRKGFWSLAVVFFSVLIFLKLNGNLSRFERGG